MIVSCRRKLTNEGERGKIAISPQLLPPNLPKDSDYGEELEGVCVVDVRGHLLQQQVDVEAQRRHVVDYVHTANEKGYLNTDILACSDTLGNWPKVSL